VVPEGEKKLSISPEKPPLKEKSLDFCPDQLGRAKPANWWVPPKSAVRKKGANFSSRNQGEKGKCTAREGKGTWKAVVRQGKDWFERTSAKGGQRQNRPVASDNGNGKERAVGPYIRRGETRSGALILKKGINVRDHLLTRRFLGRREITARC